MSKTVTIIYDGDCGLCSRAVGWLLAQPGTRPLRAVAYQDPAGPREFRQVDWAYGNRGVQVVIPDGRVLRDHRAAAYCLRAIPRWRWAGWLIDLPGLRHVTALGYRFVATYRAPISRALGWTQCRLPQGGTR